MFVAILANNPVSPVLARGSSPVEVVQQRWELFRREASFLSLRSEPTHSQAAHTSEESLQLLVDDISSPILFRGENVFLRDGMVEHLDRTSFILLWYWSALCANSSGRENIQTIGLFVLLKIARDLRLEFSTSTPSSILGIGANILSLFPLGFLLV